MHSVNCLPNNKSLDISKLKGFVDNKLNVSKVIGFPFRREENIGRKPDNSVYLHFLLFPQCFQKKFVPKVDQTCDTLVKG